MSYQQRYKLYTPRRPYAPLYVASVLCRIQIHSIAKLYVEYVNSSISHLNEAEGNVAQFNELDIVKWLANQLIYTHIYEQHAGHSHTNDKRTIAYESSHHLS